MTQRKLGNLFIAGENGSVVDLTGRHTITNAGIVTNNIAEYYWDSAYQPGSSDYRLVIQDSPDFDLISPSVEAATIDFWLQDITTNYGTVMAQHESLSKHWSFRKLQGSNVMFRPDWGIYLIGTNVPLDFEWHHHALVKQGNVYKLYSDGVLQSSATYATENLPNAPFSVFDHWYDYGPTNQKLANIRFSSEALWTSNFSIDSVSLRYESTHIPTSEIYHVGSRGNLRGKAKAGWIRPTVTQFFTSKDWFPISSRINANDNFNTGELNTDRWLDSGGTPVTFNNGRVGGTATMDHSVILKHLAELTGDFEVTVHMDISINSTGYYAGPYVGPVEGTTYIAAIFRNNNGLWSRIGSSINYGGITPSSMYFKIKRIGSTGYTYYSMTGTDWSLYHTATLSTEDVYVRLMIGVNQTTSYTVWFDDFTFVSANFTNKFKIGE